MKKLTLSEFRELPFGTNIIVHIDMPYLNRDETYNGVIVRDKIYYEDGKVDEIRTIEEYMFDDLATVYLR
jgi:hypothetical protein